MSPAAWKVLILLMIVFLFGMFTMWLLMNVRVTLV